ncbi:MFS transporter [Nocardiopsis gilva YIM 90087]|uniref:MFS transporter n=1 Tax=Nocardiopsis gilva YIM 90087 TaxID=1235441 RepID=A0A223S2N0_9ACTN|nr:MFS transporter [Nocardiopsis gilva]ASU82279.1 MFS transporter [Nocardiopsis gilva YIM 90087]
MKLNLDTVRHFPAQIWIVSIATLLNRSVGFLALFSAIFFQSFDVRANTITIALLVVGVAGVLGAVVGGRIAEKVGSAPVLVFGSLLNVPLLVILALFSDDIVVSILVAAVSVAVSQSFVGPSATLITDSGYEGATVTAFAFYRIFLNVGSIVAPAIAGVLGLVDFRLLFILSAAGSLAAFVVLFVSRSRLGEAARAAHEGDGGAAAGADAQPTEMYSTMRRARLWTVIAVFGVTIAIYAQHQSGIPLSVQRLDNGDRLYALLLLINPIIIVLTELPLSTVTAKFKWSHAYALGVFATAVGLAVCGIASSWVICIGAFVVFSLGEAVFAPLANASVARIARPRENARYQGYLSAAQSAGIALGPGIGAWGVLHDRFLFWVVVIVIGAVLAVASVFAGIRSTSSDDQRVGAAV